jgi:hypothetical protein
MARRTAKEADLWFGVLDPRKRKQIQDRLAQRARRKYPARHWLHFRGFRFHGFNFQTDLYTSAGKRLADQKEETLSARSKTHNDSIVIFSHTQRSNKGKRIPGTSSVSTAQVESISQNSESPLSSDHRLLPLPEHNLYSALFHNGVILGLACSTSSIATSSPASAHIPAPLRPTLLQTQIVHFQWIDRIPLPHVRDKMIHHMDRWSAEEFLGDIFSTTSFAIKPGRMSWDPTAWEVSRGFREKWRLLFDDTELDAE